MQVVCPNSCALSEPLSLILDILTICLIRRTSTVLLWHIQFLSSPCLNVRQVLQAIHLCHSTLAWRGPLWLLLSYWAGFIYVLFKHEVHSAAAFLGEQGWAALAMEGGFHWSYSRDLRSYCSVAPSEHCFDRRLSPCLGFASFTELDLKKLGTSWLLLALCAFRC